jgi:hypothetical protein
MMLVNSRQILSTLIVVLLVVAGLEWARQESFLLFHSLAEIFSVVIACAVFLLAWNSRDFVRNYYLLWVGIAYLFVAGLDVVHTLTFRGMGVFPDLETDTPTQLWVAARLLQAVALVVAPAFIRRRPAILPTFAGMGAYAVLVLLAVFRWKVFPVCYIDDPQVGYPLRLAGSGDLLAVAGASGLRAGGATLVNRCASDHHCLGDLVYDLPGCLCSP